MWLIKKFEENKNKTAIIYDNTRFSYADLIGRIEYYTDFFHKNGIKSGSTLLLSTQFSFDAVAFLLANIVNTNILAIVDSNNNLNLDKLSADSYADYVAILGDKLNIIQKEECPKHNFVKQLQSVRKAGLILFSSGTTGVPKIMLHDFSKMVESYKTDSVKEINSLIMMGLDHIGGIDSLLRLLSICATITLSKDRNPDNVCQLIDKFQIEVLPATPTFLNLLFLSGSCTKYNLSSIKIIGFGAEPMPDILLKKVRETFPSARLQQKFGTTETNAIKIFNQQGDEHYFRIEDKKVEHKIVEGELWLKSQNNMIGYLNLDQQPFIEDGWINTGDLVDVRSDGFIKILGRKKEVINVGGEKVLPVEVEDYLLQIPYVVDCKVYGMPNLFTGSIVVADVVVSGSAPQNIKSEIIKFCKGGLPSYKIPVKIKFVETIILSARQKKTRIQ